MPYLKPDKGPYPDEYRKPPHERDVVKLSKQDAYKERLRDAVIEAAKAYAAVYGDQGASGLNVHGALLRAVEALEAEAPHHCFECGVPIIPSPDPYALCSECLSLARGE